MLDTLFSKWWFRLHDNTHVSRCVSSWKLEHHFPLLAIVMFFSFLNKEEVVCSHRREHAFHVWCWKRCVQYDALACMVMHVFQPIHYCAGEIIAFNSEPTLFWTVLSSRREHDFQLRCRTPCVQNNVTASTIMYYCYLNVHFPLGENILFHSDRPWFI